MIHEATELRRELSNNFSKWYYIKGCEVTGSNGNGIIVDVILERELNEDNIYIHCKIKNNSVIKNVNRFQTYFNSVIIPENIADKIITSRINSKKSRTFSEEKTKKLDLLLYETQEINKHLIKINHIIFKTNNYILDFASKT